MFVNFLLEDRTLMSAGALDPGFGTGGLAALNFGLHPTGMMFPVGCKRAGPINRAMVAF